MASYEYKTVPAPMILTIKTEKDADQAIANFGTLINKEAVDGWEFHSMETITTEEAPGCLGGGKNTAKHYNMLIFKREIPTLEE